MFTFEWDDLQPRKDQHLLYFQGLAGCKLQNRVSLKPFNPDRGAVTHGLPVLWCISGSVLMMLRSTQRNIMENLNIGGGMTGALGNRGNQTRARSSVEKGLEGRHLPPSLLQHCLSSGHFIWGIVTTLPCSPAPSCSTQEVIVPMHR